MAGEKLPERLPAPPQKPPAHLQTLLQRAGGIFFLPRILSLPCTAARIHPGHPTSEPTTRVRSARAPTLYAKCAGKGKGSKRVREAVSVPLPACLPAARLPFLPLPSTPLYLGPVKNDISSWRASISICILLEALRFRAEDISALSRQN